jgi:O-antigen ligase
MLTQLSPFQGIVLVGLVAILLGTLIEPFVGLTTALFVGPLKAYLSSQVPQIPAQVGHLFVVLALGSWLARRLSRHDLRIRQSPLLLALLVFIGAALLSLWDATGLVDFGTLELIKWVEMVLLFVFVSHHLAAKMETGPTSVAPSLQSRRLRWLVASVFGVGLFQAGMGIWQFGLRGEGPDHFAILGGDFFRAYGTFQQPNPYGGYLGLTAALALGVIADGVRGELARWYSRRRGGEGVTHRSTNLPGHQSADLPVYVLACVSCLALTIALGASWSRGAWIGFGAAMVAMTAALPRRTGWGILLVALLAIGALGLHASGRLPASFAARLTSFVQDIRLEDVRGIPINEANYAALERLAHWQSALSMFRDSLWSGIGFGCYEAAYRQFALINWPIALGHAHNYYLNLAAETGLIGLIAYVFLWGVVFRQTWRATRRAYGLTRGLAIGLLGTWTHISVHHLLDNLYVNNVHLQIGVLLGVLAFINEQTSKAASLYDLQA